MWMLHVSKLMSIKTAEYLFPLQKAFLFQTPHTLFTSLAFLNPAPPPPTEISINLVRVRKGCVVKAHTVNQ